MAEDWRQRVDRLVRAAVAAGTHSEGPPLRVCEGCGQWRGAWHKTLDGKYLCYDCTPANEREKVAKAR